MTTLFFVCSLLQISDQIVNTNAFFFFLFFFLLQRTSERSVPIAVRFHRTLELGDDKYYVITCGRSAFRNSRSVSSFFLSQFGAKHIIVRFSFFCGEERERDLSFWRRQIAPMQLTFYLLLVSVGEKKATAAFFHGWCHYANLFFPPQSRLLGDNERKKGKLSLIVTSEHPRRPYWEATVIFTFTFDALNS